MTLLDSLMRRALQLGASDLHLQAGHRPRIRLGGDLVFAHEQTAPLTGEDLEAMSAELAVAEGIAPGGADFAFRDAGGVQWRVHQFQQYRGPGLALRPLAQDVPSLVELHLPSELERLISLRSGLVLIGGPCGSGKTTTLAALLQQLNQGQRRAVITLEDPVEYELTSAHSLVHQRAVGLDVGSFEQGLRDALVERPDVLAVGELRSLESIRLALEAAETGLLVFATLHAADAAHCLQRLIEGFPGAEQAVQRERLAHSIQAVVGQVLLHAKEGRGRYPACELLLRTSAVAHLIREGRFHEARNCIQTGAEQGMLLLDDSLADLVTREQVKVEEARGYAVDPRRLPGGAESRRRGRALAEPHEPERRAEERVATLALANLGESDEVGFKSELSTARTSDISLHGARLELDHSLLIGAQVELTFALDDQVVGVVASVRSCEEAEGGRFALGLRFERVSPEASAAIEAYLQLRG